jgi:hypothetical protein
MAATTPTTVGITAVPIYTAPGVTQPGSAPVVVSNLGAAAVFLGGPNVTATTGVQVAPGANLPIPSVSQATIYAIAATGTNNVVVGVF